LDYNCANTCEAAGYRMRALGYLLKSLAAYPLPFANGVMRTSFERPKRVGVVLMRLLLQRSPESPVRTNGRGNFVDALEARKGVSSGGN
jgi:hypothetical protein